MNETPKRETVVKRLRTLYKDYQFLSKKKLAHDKESNKWRCMTKSQHAIGFAINTILDVYQDMDIQNDDFHGAASK